MLATVFLAATKIVAVVVVGIRRIRATKLKYAGISLSIPTLASIYVDSKLHFMWIHRQ